MKSRKRLLIGMIAAALVMSAVTPPVALARSTRVTVYPKHRWHGYGFLPGYRPQAAEALGIPRMGPERPHPEMRFWRVYGDFAYGEPSYGWGYPGYYRGRWNGGSFGPCWVSTPIGMMPTC